MGDGDQTALSPQARVGAGAGAAVVAAVVLNPLDVIKTRIQAQSFAFTSAPAQLPRVSVTAACPCHTSTLYEQHRSICSSTSSRASAAEALPHHLALSHALSHPHGVTGLAVSDVGGASSHAPWPHRTWGVACDNAVLVRRVMAPGVGGGGAAASAAYESMWQAFRHIVQQEGVGALWRGTGASLLMSVPMVGIYMPLYDILMEQWKGTGAAAPLLAGSAARGVACFAVAPFELMRTRLQATPGSSVHARDTLRSLLGADSTAGALRAVPRLWTGFTATLVRDVPFSALYWAMVEPLRHGILAQRQQYGSPLMHQAQAAAQPLPATQSLQPQASGTSNAPAIAQPLQQQGSGTSSFSAASPSSSSVSATAGAGSEYTATCHHTPQDIVLANITAGFIAGGAAAAVTTPFDVVKTRHQVSMAPWSALAAAGSSSRQSVLGTLAEVYRSEGMAGLFSGVRPRAYRAAPACAIVISCYELLKDWLA